MIVLHAALRGEALQVWGERPRREDREPDGTSPYDPGADALTSALRAAGLATPPPTASVTGWLPTVKGAPVASSPLIAEPAAGGAPVLRPWTLTACTFRSRRGRLIPGRLRRPRVAGRRRVRRQGPGLRGGGAAVRGRPRRPPSARAERGGERGRLSRRLAAGDRGRGRRAVHRPCPRDARDRPGRRRGRGGASGHSPPPALLGSFVAALVDHLARAANALETAPASDRTFDSLHDQWIHALRSPDGTMLAAPAELARFERQVQEWHRPVTLAATAPFRLTFRLEEPDRRRRDGDRQRRQRVLDRPLPPPGRARPQPARERGGRLERRARGARCGREGFDAGRTSSARSARPRASPAHRGEPARARARRVRPRRARRLRFPEPQLDRRWSRPASASSCRPGGRARAPSAGWRSRRVVATPKHEERERAVARRSSSKFDWEVALGDETS